MTDTPKILLDGAHALGDGAIAARRWIQRLARTAGSVAAEERSLLLEARRAENLARKLAVSAGRRNCVGVFGPSQAGKSYLVSVLGRNHDQPLIADFAGIPKNFIQDINPSGGQESTGLVTRFTIVPGTRDTVQPVELRLLTETDLVKILGNSFLSDFGQHTRKVKLRSEDEIRAVVARLEPSAGAIDNPHLDEIAMFDLCEYFTSHFEVTTPALGNAGYWDALTRFGARLPRAQRIEMYSMVWGGVPDLTEIYALMQAALEQLGHPTEARCVLDGLLPRERSLINVDLVKNDLGTVADGKDLLSVVPQRKDGSDGPTVQVSRATLCALTAELKIVMSVAAWPFLQHTDLLDFPGARSREQMIDFDPKPSIRAEEIRNMVRRGKVSYLFQRYTEERELSSMMLCMPPKPAEVKDLSSLVTDWVDQTHGEKPEQRAALPCGLFFVLTFFDREFDTKPGDTETALRGRIDARIESSMFGLYKHQGWFQNWAGGKPFSNTYFMRNPEFKMPDVMTYESCDGKEVETGLQNKVLPLIDTLRSGMLASENANKHFADPGRAWDETMRLNDGGVSYLVGQLQLVLSPTLKTRQLSGRLLRQAQSLDERLRRFYHADDEQSRRKKDEALLQLRRDLHRSCAAAEFRNFFQLLGCMKLADEEGRGVFLNVGMRPEADPASAPTAPVAEASPWDTDPWGEPAPNADAWDASPPPHLHDRFDMFAHQVINLWTERLRGLSTNDRVTEALRIAPAVLGDLANEIVIAANRLKLGDRIATLTRAQVAVANLRPDDAADRSAGIAAMILNDFVAYLGYAELPAAQRPAFPETATRPPAVAIFESPERPAPGELPQLADRRRTIDREYFRDWGVGLRQLGLDNISHAGAREIGEEDNRLLGLTLRKLAPALTESES